MVLFFLTTGGFSSTTTNSSTLASALFSKTKPDLESSKLRVTLGFEESFFREISLVATSSIPLIVNVVRCSYTEPY
jgi:hypothetical protein